MIGRLAAGVTGGKPLATPGALLMLAGMGMVYWALSGWHLFGLGNGSQESATGTSRGFGGEFGTPAPATETKNRIGGK